MRSRTIAVSGELGSGKSAVSSLLSDALGARRVSTGEAQRHIAEQRGVSTLELNRLAEADPTIDEEVDSVFRSLASLREALVVDSRLAWHFLPDALKVHLVVSPEAAADRVLRREGSAAEHYRTRSEALGKLHDRASAERERFLAVYGVDIFDLGNYDLVIDTTRVAPEDVAAAVVAVLEEGAPPTPRPALWLDPARLRPGPTAPEAALGQAAKVHAAKVQAAKGQAARGQALANAHAVVVAYDRPTFTVVRGWELVGDAVTRGLALVPAVLAGSVSEP